MYAEVKNHKYDLNRPLDISIALREGKDQPNCFHAPFFETSPVRTGDFVGSTREGGPLNFLNIKMNPHGNGTHTECVGHIATDFYSIHRCLKQFLWEAVLLSVRPVESGDDLIIRRDPVIEALQGRKPEALILRTLPNGHEKMKRHYSGTNPPYLEAALAGYLAEKQVKHLLVDLPSVDREEDGGMLAAHKAFWQYPAKPRTEATITELIYVPDQVTDGHYLLNLQIASFDIDVSPSKPVLYPRLEA